MADLDPALVDSVRRADVAVASVRAALAAARRLSPGRRMRFVDGTLPEVDLAGMLSEYNDALDEHSLLASRIAVLRNRIRTHPQSGQVETFERRAGTAALEASLRVALTARAEAIQAALAAGATKNQLGRDVGHDPNWTRRVLRQNGEH